MYKKTIQDKSHSNPKVKFFQIKLHESNFYQTINEFLFLNSKFQRFFRVLLLPKNTLLSILKIIYLSIKDNLLNYNLFSNISAKNFVSTFRCLGTFYSNFILLLSKMCFSEHYYFSNNLFIDDIIRYTLNLSDPVNKRMILEPSNLKNDELDKQLKKEEKKNFDRFYKVIKEGTEEENIMKEMENDENNGRNIENSIYEYIDRYCNSKEYV